MQLKYLNIWVSISQVNVFLQKKCWEVDIGPYREEGEGNPKI